MNTTLTYYNDYKSLGLTVVPVEWDIIKKEPVSHRLWSETSDLKISSNHNAIMIKTGGCWASLDFDLKNTKRKTLFEEWKTMVLNQWPEIYDKVYIEKTRNAGYHVWLKYNKLEKKLSLAESELGNEVIALYAKGPLVYTFPTPGYTEYHSSMQDVQELTDKEFEYLISTSQIFNEYKPEYDPTLKAVNYPAGYESLLSQFDSKIPDDIWDTILSVSNLVPITNYKYHTKDKFVAFRREGSSSDAISAKVFYKTKRVLIFSASLNNFPNWHNRADYDNIWSLPPSFMLFYQHERSWDKTIEQIKGIIETIGLDIDVPPVITTDYPLHVFPAAIHQSILDVCHHRSLAPSFVATAGLWTISSLAGTRYHSDFKSDGKNILFCLMIAPVSVGKTPAYKVMCETPLRVSHEALDKRYKEDLDGWVKKKADAGKEAFTEKKPTRFIPISADGTTEGYLHKSMMQPNGIGIYQDEAETILNAGNFKATNDAISFFTQAFSGGRITQVRADETKERVVPNLNLNLLMGTQPSRVKNIFTEDRLSSGFASRFLMVESDYMELNTNSDPFGEKKEMCSEWNDIVTGLFFSGMRYNAGEAEQIFITITDGAKNAYRKYYKELLTDANVRIKSKSEEYIIGTEAKMSAYLPRLIQILAIIYDHTGPVITEDIVHKGYTLYRYYAESTIKIIANLNGEIETGLPADLELLYQTLPDEFTRKEAADICIRINLKERRFDNSIRRKDFGKLFQKTGQGHYKKI